jgi:hypothetical protein
LSVSEKLKIEWSCTWLKESLGDKGCKGLGDWVPDFSTLVDDLLDDLV